MAPGARVVQLVAWRNAELVTAPPRNETLLAVLFLNVTRWLDDVVPNVSDVALAVTPPPVGVVGVVGGGVVVVGGVDVAGGVAPPPPTAIETLPVLDVTVIVPLFDPATEAVYDTETRQVWPAARDVQADLATKRALLDVAAPTVTVDDVLLVSLTACGSVDVENVRLYLSAVRPAVVAGGVGGVGGVLGGGVVAVPPEVFDAAGPNFIAGAPASAAPTSGPLPRYASLKLAMRMAPS